ncbi:MAG: MarR family transcriptional regulator [Fimbriimonadaceae bacterium]|nr:MarR family transcriptional regulator [Fimbriimonadaceae bacterium]QYK55924.1 MAG: MarR family transcriptional regulator [Fimbriimonadaceae bacterium]
MDSRDRDAGHDVSEVEDRFVVEWGRMSSSWGINRTMAQIHALLLLTGRPFTVEELIERLHISRGNASMNLRDLVDWGIIRRSRNPGDRKDTYQSEADVYQVFARVIRERKRREIDPTVDALRECLAMVPTEDESGEAEKLKERLRAILEIFGTIDRIYDQVFLSDDGFRQAVRLLNDGDLGFEMKKVR